MPKIQPLTLSTLIPTAILGIGAASVLIAFLITRPLVYREVLNEQQSIDKVATARIQTLLEAAARFANPVFVQESMAAVTETDTNASVMVISTDGTIVASSEFKRVTRPVSDFVAEEIIRLFAETRQSIAPLSHLDENANILSTLARVCASRSMARIPREECSIVLFQRDLEPAIREHLLLLQQQVFINAGGVLLAALATIFLLQSRLLRPIQRLQATLAAYEHGRSDVRVRATGHDEAATVAQAVNDLLDHVEEARLATEFSEQRFRAMFENNTEGMVVITEQGFITDINRTAELMFGYAPGELLGARVERLMTEDHAVQHSQYVTSYTTSGRSGIIGTQGRELEGRRKDGDVFPLKLGVGEVRTGDVRYFVATIVDLSEINRLQNQLQRSQKMDAIGQLAGGIAHDFNNLLGIVIGNLDLLKRKTPNDANVHKYADKALGAATRGADLTRRLLGFSRQKASHGEAVDVNATITGLEQLLDRSVTSRIEMEVALADGLWLAEVDRGQLEDVLINLTLNARDAMPDGGRLIIETENFSTRTPIKADIAHGNGTGDFVLITLSDTGHGITQELKDKIFEPFFTTKDEGKGTGLGLAMVYGFLKRFQGCLSVYSEVGMGTTIRLYLPRAIDRDNTEQHEESDQSLPTGTETILVVDDEPDLVDLAKNLLSSLGYHTLSASNGAEALEILAANPDVTLLFSDVVMPGELSGFQLAREATARHPKLKVLLASGFTGRLLTTDQGEEWRDQLMAKPYRDVELAQRVRAIIDEE